MSHLTKPLTNETGSMIFSLVGVVVLVGSLLAFAYLNTVTETVGRLDDQINSQAAHYAAQAELVNQMYRLKFANDAQLNNLLADHQLLSNFGDAEVNCNIENPGGTTYHIDCTADVQKNFRSIRAEINRTPSSGENADTAEVVFLVDTSGSMFEDSCPQVDGQADCSILPECILAPHNQYSPVTCEPFATALMYAKDGMNTLNDPIIEDKVRIGFIGFDTKANRLSEILEPFLGYHERMADELFPTSVAGLLAAPENQYFNLLRPNGYTNLHQAMHFADRDLFTTDTSVKNRFLIIITDSIFTAAMQDSGTGNCHIYETNPLSPFYCQPLDTTDPFYTNYPLIGSILINPAYELGRKQAYVYKKTFELADKLKADAEDGGKNVCIVIFDADTLDSAAATSYVPGMPSVAGFSSNDQIVLVQGGLDAIRSPDGTDINGAIDGTAQSPNCGGAYTYHRIKDKKSTQPIVDLINRSIKQIPAGGTIIEADPDKILPTD